MKKQILIIAFMAIAVMAHAQHDKYSLWGTYVRGGYSSTLGYVGAEGILDGDVSVGIQFGYGGHNEGGERAGIAINIYFAERDERAFYIYGGGFANDVEVLNSNLEREYHPSFSLGLGHRFILSDFMDMRLGVGGKSYNDQLDVSIDIVLGLSVF